MIRTIFNQNGCAIFCAIAAQLDALELGSTLRKSVAKSYMPLESPRIAQDERAPVHCS